jgi:hypothetical protein
MMRITSRRMLAVASTAGLIVAAGGAYGLVSALGSTGGRDRVFSRAGRYVDRRFGWTIRVPAGMVVGSFRNSGASTSFTTDGARLTNFAPDLDAPSRGSPAMGWLRSFPARGVALQLWFGERLPTVPPLRDTRLPLPRGSFHPIRLGGGRVYRYAGGAEPAPLYRTFFADGFPFAAAVWFGPRASRADRRAVWRIVTSLRFPPLQGGTFWQDRYYVLGRASRYPTGTVTLVPSSSLPAHAFRPEGLYLIHAPRAFYAIRQIFETQSGPRIQCKMAFDRRAFQFFCPGTDRRWDRVGQPLGPHAGSQAWALNLVPATVADDGHVLFSPFFDNALRFDLKGNPWA